MAQEQSGANDSISPEAGTPTSGRGKLIWAAVGLVLLLAVAAGAYYFLQPGAPAVEVEAAEQPDVPAEARKPQYLALDKLLVNFDYQGGIRYVQTEIQLKAFNEEALAEAEYNMPAVRNRLIMLLSDQDFDQLRKVEGKEALRKAVLGAVNSELSFSGDKVISDVYFTSFVLQ